MLKVASSYGLVAVASLSFVGAAAADGYESAGSLKDSAPPPIAYEWNGLSVGAGIGIGHFDQDAHGKAWRKDRFDKYKKYCYNCKWVHKYGYEIHKKLESSATDDDWNVFGTVQIGYDRLLGDRFLIGAFADFDFYKDADLTFSDKKGYKSLNGKVEKDNIWTVGGRLGYLVTPRVLVYGLAGFSRMSLEGKLDAHFGPANIPLSIDENVDGWTVGGGVETKLDQRVSLKLEYRYSEFDGASAKVTDKDDDVWKKNKWLVVHSMKEGAKLDLDDTEVHSVRAVLSFKLGGHETVPEPLK